MAEKRYRICPLCEATCGLEFSVEGRKVLSVRGDKNDPFSEGYICPKGVALKDLDEDPDRLRTPMVRDAGGWKEATWEKAFSLVDSRLSALLSEHGRDSVGVYLGNPTAHNFSLSAYVPALLRTLGTANRFSAGTVDQVPKQLSSGLLFGTGLSIPIPDIDRCQYLLVIGADPLESNGSLMTAPNVPKRLKRIRERGGRIVVIDPRRSKTARASDEHHFIQPGTDSLFLMAIVHTLFAENLVALGPLAEHTAGIEEIEAVVSPFTPESVAKRCGIAAETIRAIARETAKESAVVYCRFGASTQQFGTLTNWLADVIHVLTGNLDRPGGALFAQAAHGGSNAKGPSGKGKGLRIGRRKSRVSGHEELFGEFPVACLAEEIETPGEGQIRGMIVVAGNPILSNPNSERLSKAFESLDFMVSLDIYLNETSRHADVILPGLSPLETCQFDPAFAQLAIQNHARFSPAMFSPPEGLQPEWKTLLRLAAIVSGMGPNADIEPLDAMVIDQMIQREIGLSTSPIHGRDAADIVAALEPRLGPERLVDFMIRTGPHGEGFGVHPDGLTLERLEKNPGGIDLGALKSRVPEVLRTTSGKIELAPQLLIDDVDRLREFLDESKPELVLIGRRDLRSNNSWMHNLNTLVSGKPRCTAHIHPNDAARFGLQNGETAEVSSRVGSVIVPVEITDDIMEGVVSIPHGWGHGDGGTHMKVAEAHAGVNVNVLSDEAQMDKPSGTSVLCGVPITMARCENQEEMSDSNFAAVK